MRSIFVCLLLTLFVGCAPKTMYSWGNYDNALYDYYKNPTELEEFRMDLDKIISRAEIRGNVPPGLYAEYGYVLFEQKNYRQAIMFFEKEKTLWPESVVIIDKMIENANKAMASQN